MESDEAAQEAGEVASAEDKDGKPTVPVVMKHVMEGGRHAPEVPIAPPLFDADFAATFTALLCWRRDVRHFSARQVAEQDMADLLAHAGLAPSVGNSQPWRFVRLRSAALREALAEHVDAQSVRAAQRYAGNARHDDYTVLKLHDIREAPELMAVFCDDQARAGHGLGCEQAPKREPRVLNLRY